VFSLAKMSATDQSQFEFKGKTGKGKRGKFGSFAGDSREIEKLFDRLPPFSNEAEMSLLGSMILDHRVCAEIIGLIPTGE